MSPEQCKAARALLGLDQEQVAVLAKVARTTLIDFEKGLRAPRTSTIAAIRAALEAAGVEFIEPNGGGAGVRLRK
ncbi:helix-turn-helix domain-containing protein [Roseovarius mucosus]|uniref:helix-turn-helix domain-containing protein n=1 Tax=Roseovarius mucosus TaxID=215743 RepID=UPI003F701590